MTTNPDFQPSILVVDDNEDAATSLAALFRLRGCDARAVFDPFEALAEVARRRPDLVLLDLGMPRLDGYELARRIRAAIPDRPPQFVAVTGWGLDEDRARSRAEGFALHLVKPLPPDAIDDVLALAKPRP